MSRPWEAPNPAYLQTAQLGGVAAAATVLLGTPLAAAFFASEVMYRNRPVLEKLFLFPSRRPDRPFVFKASSRSKADDVRGRRVRLP
jgi:hypothetical protein